MTPLIGGAINALLFRPGRTVAYLGVEVFFSALTTAFICNLIYCRTVTPKKVRDYPPMPYDLKTHVFYKYFPKSGDAKQSAFLAVVTAVITALLPALMLMITGLHTVATAWGWVGCKMLASVVYSSFSAYHMIAYRATMLRGQSSAQQEGQK